MINTSPNTAYTAHYVRPNFGFAETSYMLRTLGETLGKLYGGNLSRCLSGLE